MQSRYTNVLNVRSIHFLSAEEQGCFYEWLIAQELMRRFVMEGREILAPLYFWQNQTHEIDFVIDPTTLLEVKRGRSGPLEFGWFEKQFPQARLRVINTENFETQAVEGVRWEAFLEERP